jgi:hypothetical protein
VDIEHISQKVTSLLFHFFRNEGFGDCLNSELPDCQDNEVIVFNDFGHPVCFCPTNTTDEMSAQPVPMLKNSFLLLCLLFPK